ncbi:MAG: hypothetical protein EXX96DRAFT_458176, partial [Benjaminiella poitrasii]
KSTGRPFTFDSYTERHLERVIRRGPFQTLETFTGQLRLMGKYMYLPITRKWVDKLDFKHYKPAVKPKLSEEHIKTKDRDGYNLLSMGPMNN